MADKRPEIPEGYLGPHEKFADMGLSTMSHPDPEIIARDNHIEVKVHSTKPVKFTYSLLDCRSDKELSQYVFAQKKEDVIHFLVHMPEAGYYKLQLYALSASDPSKSVPNVYNYLIHCTRAALAVCPFPKQYAQWREGCYLHEPLILNANSTLTNIHWKVNVPHANNVAVVIESDWFQLEHRGGPVWEKKISLDKFRGKKVTLSANFEGTDESKFATLLEYHI